MKTYVVCNVYKLRNMTYMDKAEYDDRQIHVYEDGEIRDIILAKDRAGKTTELDKILKELEEKGYRKEVENEQVDTIRSSNYQRERS